MAECGARVVTQSQAHEREAAGGSIVAARGAQGQVAWEGRARGGGGSHARGYAGRAWLDRSVGRLGLDDGPIDPSPYVINSGALYIYIQSDYT
jgi:hypothetical protein